MSGSPDGWRAAIGDGAERRRKVRPSWIALGALGVLGLIVVGVPLATLLYIGVLMLCPLMMVGMHRGHGGHGGHDAYPRRHEGLETGDPKSLSHDGHRAEG